MRPRTPRPPADNRIAGRWATALAGATLVCGSVDTAAAGWATGAAVAVMIAEIVRDHRQSKVPFLAGATAAAAAGLLMPGAFARQAALVVAAAAAAVSAAAWRGKLARRRRRAKRRSNAKERP